MYHQEDVITAISTPIGEGGISVIRVSGKDAITIAESGFRGKISLKEAASHTVHYGYFVNKSGEVIDDVLVTIFREPHSYTAENVVEISCHGSIFVAKKILESLIDFGARLAEQGEFTKRAFLNGRLDLSQAEAVADLIRSRTDMSHKASISQLQGRLSAEINLMREKIIDLCSLMELELDFVEEDIHLTDKGEIINATEVVINSISKLISTFKSGKVFKEGVKVVIAGCPNVGKSSILNSLLRENRVIVSEIPGTTRDTIEESLSINGILFKVTDTAGLRTSQDIIEIEGIKRTHLEIENADIVIFVIDSSIPVTEDVLKMLNDIERKVGYRENILIAINKIDILSDSFKMLEIFKQFKNVCLSAKTGIGMNLLREQLYDIALQGDRLNPETSVVITNMRHLSCLIRSRDSLYLALEGMKKGISNEFIVIDLRASLNALGEITGAVVSEDILNNIFSKFCIGK